VNPNWWHGDYTEFGSERALPHVHRAQSCSSPGQAGHQKFEEQAKGKLQRSGLDKKPALPSTAFGLADLLTEGNL
jgi:hypothetical protein